MHPESVEVLVTREVSLSCSATGVPPPAITWLKEGVSISNTTANITFQQLGTSTTTSILTLHNTSLTDAANYTCMANNTLATDLSDQSTKAFITVLCK